MPLPLGHTAIGLAVFETTNKPTTCGSRIRLFGFVTLLANLPDFDILFGLLTTGNGAAFHRGPTHSLLFAIIAGYLASKISDKWRGMPSLGFGLCTLIIFSHVIADLLFTSGPISLLWPLETNWTTGHSGWFNVIHMALFQSVQDFIIAGVALIYLFALRHRRGVSCLSNIIPTFAFKK